MVMLPQEIIRKKRRGLALSPEDIRGFFVGFLKGEVADYQVAAMLMAIVLRGMTRDEASALTLTMRDSGEVLTWSGSKDDIVDKHSTGGVGDKTSLIIMPLCILEGLKVPMIAGRGLGHTGGTLDKLESIDGLKVYLTSQDAEMLLKKNGGVFMGQTEQIAPLDKRLYALRDVTDTVESVPLITASILSKKLAEGIGSLVMDVKFGSGAFMQDKNDALALAESISSVGKASGLHVRCALTDMGSPLGDRAGNSLEVAECVEVLRGSGPASTRDLSIQLATEMVLLARPSESRDAVVARLSSHLDSGRAFEVFSRVVVAQGGDLRQVEDPEKLPKAKYVREICATKTGVIADCDVRELGLAIVELGGGRRRAADKVNHAVGLSSLKRVGDRISAGDVLALIHADNLDRVDSVSKRVASAYVLKDTAKAESLIWRFV
jgi:pyrimidine-nucleoside phosphorylase